jgi:hypothetical protein
MSDQIKAPGQISTQPPDAWGKPPGGGDVVGTNEMG